MGIITPAILLSAGCFCMAAGLLVLAFLDFGVHESENVELDAPKGNLILGGMFVYIAGYQTFLDGAVLSFSLHASFRRVSFLST